MRDFAIPARVATFNNQGELNRLLNKHGDTDVYFSVYERTGPDYDSAIVDKLYFDLEFKGSKTRPPEYWMQFIREQAFRLGKFMASNGCRTEVIDSGRGFHVVSYFSRTAKLLRAKRSLRDLCQRIIEQCPCPAMDWSVIGDVARIRRIPGSTNSKTGTKCQVLTTYGFNDQDRILNWLEAIDALIVAKEFMYQGDGKSPAVICDPNHSCNLFDNIMENGTQRGEQNNTAVFLISKMRYLGISKDETIRQMDLWRKKSKPQPEDMSGLVERLYSKTTYHSCVLGSKLSIKCSNCPWKK